MKKSLFLFLAIMLLGACAEDVMVHNVMNTSVTGRSTFSYDSVTNPEVWKTFMSFEEMMNATQIPEDILKELPTDTLVALCMNHPMAGNYLCYNNHIKGALSVMKRFNGFQELKRREDAAEKIMDFYEKMDIDYNVIDRKKNPYARYRTEVKPLQVGFTELVIATKDIPELYSDKNIDRLERIANVKYEAKIQNKKYNKVSALGHSLLIGAQIKMKKEGKSNTKLQQFIDKGGDIRTQKDFTEISRIIYSK